MQTPTLEWNMMTLALRWTPKNMSNGEIGLCAPMETNLSPTHSKGPM